MNFPVFPIVTFVVCAASVGWSVKVTKDAAKDREAMAAEVRRMEVRIGSIEEIHSPYSPSSKQWLEKEKEWDWEFQKLQNKVQRLENER